LLIGVSTHSLEDVKRAASGGADFVVLGPVFDTPSKRQYGPPLGLEIFADIVRQTQIPIVGIGGINLGNVRQVLDGGAAGIAAIRLFMESPMEDVVRRIARRALTEDWR
jgi:thiamine-phosphate pyrophosphorylase